MATIEITRDDLVVIAPQLPAGVDYDGSHLEIADADAENVEALIDDIANLRSAALKSSLLVYAADKRWRVETGGIVVGGMSVATDDRSKLMITGARVKADKDAAFTTNWKTPAGFVEIDAATIIAISNAVLDHVDASFAIEGAVLAGIEAGTITTQAQIDAADWP